MMTGTAVPGAQPAVENLESQAPAASRPNLLASLLAGVGGLGSALLLERGGSFLSNVLAARLGGPKIFGAYSVSLSAATNVAWYASAGIGDTSTRFIAPHPPHTAGYRRVVRTLAIIAAVSTSLAILALWLGAAPMAERLYHNPVLITPLKLAALSAGAFVMVECCRGVFIGTRSFASLLAVSAVIGAGLLAAIPAAAKSGPAHMVAGQVAVFTIAIALSIFLILKPAKPRSPHTLVEIETPPLSRIWKFGLMQLGGVVGMNAAGWWTAVLVTRGDASLLQIAFYTVATQLRNVFSLIPSMVQHGNLAFFTDEGAGRFGGTKGVVAVSSLLASALASTCACIAAILLPWILHFMYGPQYAHAELAGAFAIATILVHFGEAPAASRLLFISLLGAGAVNGLWALFVVIMATVLVPAAGAAAATGVLFAAHTVSMFLVLIGLWRLQALPSGLTRLAVLDTAVAVGLCALAWLRTIHPAYWVRIDLLILLLMAATWVLLLGLAKQCGALPKSLRFGALPKLWRAH